MRSAGADPWTASLCAADGLESHHGWPPWLCDTSRCDREQVNSPTVAAGAS